MNKGEAFELLELEVESGNDAVKESNSSLAATDAPDVKFSTEWVHLSVAWQRSNSSREFAFCHSSHKITLSKKMPRKFDNKLSKQVKHIFVVSAIGM